jgi:hypothetical protein
MPEIKITILHQKLRYGPTSSQQQIAAPKCPALRRCWLAAHATVAMGSLHGSWPKPALAPHAQLVALGGLSPLVFALHG